MTSDRDREMAPDDGLVFKALADPGRRALLDSLNARNGQSLRGLCAALQRVGHDMARQSVSKHLAVLKRASLVVTVRHGRETLHYLNPVPISAIADRWISRYDRTRAAALADLKTALEESPMSEENGRTEAEKPAFVYTTYIKTTPERLWQALTEPAFTKRYWGTTFESDWHAGSNVVWEFDGVRMEDPDQVVLESEPPRRLSYTWHTITEEFARAVGADDETYAAFSAEPRSKVTFEIEPLGEMVKLTVVHDGFEPGSRILDGISEGWPGILSSLKTLLETGDTLPQPA